jgi:hypothetical protein
MRTISFDSGPVISLATNNLLWILKPLKERFRGQFLVTPAVRRELVEQPLAIKRFEFEALQVLREIKTGTFAVVPRGKLDKDRDVLFALANNLFSAKGTSITLLHQAEVEAIAGALAYEAKAIVIDERTSRLLIEQPLGLRDILQEKLHTKIVVDMENFRALQKRLSGLKVIRSLELCLAAVELGLLDDYLPEKMSKKVLLDAVLWGLRLKGCSIPEDDLQDVLAGKMGVSL